VSLEQSTAGPARAGTGTPKGVRVPWQGEDMLEEQEKNQDAQCNCTNLETRRKHHLVHGPCKRAG